jgi:hypothetical protein
MWFLRFHEIMVRLAHFGEYVPAILITVGVGMLVACSVGCVCSPCEEKDDLFHDSVF